MSVCACETYKFEFGQGGFGGLYSLATENGSYNSKPLYDLPYFAGSTLTTWKAYYVSGTWYIHTVLGETNLAIVLASAPDVDGCLPLGSWTLQNDPKLDFLTNVGCSSQCQCIKIVANYRLENFEFTATIGGTFNGNPYYVFTAFETVIYLWYYDGEPWPGWQMTTELGGGGSISNGIITENPCPEGIYSLAEA